MRYFSTLSSFTSHSILADTGEKGFGYFHMPPNRLEPFFLMEPIQERFAEGSIGPRIFQVDPPSRIFDESLAPALLTQSHSPSQTRPAPPRPPPTPCSAPSEEGWSGLSPPCARTMVADTRFQSIAIIWFLFTITHDHILPGICCTISS